MFARREFGTAFPVSTEEAAATVEAGSAFGAAPSEPSIAQLAVAGSRAAPRGHARFCTRRFRIALRFTGLPPFTLRRDGLGWSHRRLLTDMTAKWLYRT